MHASKIIEVIKRAEDGPICMEKDFDFSIMRLKLKELIADHDIRYDPDILVPSDDSLADAVFNAALELYLETGTYCLSTHRQIKFDEGEIRLALHEAPSQIIFGEGQDARVMTNVKFQRIFTLK
jgi:methylamine--corrinoid protein Co-methyltransferase